MRQGRRAERGGVLLEFPLVVGLVLIPLGMLALSASTWVERQTAARDAAAESARAIVLAGPDSKVTPASVLADVEAGYGFPAGTLRGAIPEDGLVPGASVTVEVTVEIPALSLPIVGDIGAVDWTTEHTERLPDYGADR